MPELALQRSQESLLFLF